MDPLNFAGQNSAHVLKLSFAVAVKPEHCPPTLQLQRLYNEVSDRDIQQRLVLKEAYNAGGHCVGSEESSDGGEEGGGLHFDWYGGFIRF